MSDELMTALDGLTQAQRDAAAKTEKRLADLAAEVKTQRDAREQMEARVAAIETKAFRPAGGFGAGNREAEEHKAAFTAWLRDPHNERKAADLRDLEAKAASGVTDAAGGFLVPEVIAGPLMMRARDANSLRPIVRNIAVASGDVRLPLSNGDATQGWVGETGTRAATDEPTLIAPKPTFGTNYALVSASEELVMDSVFDLASWFTTEAGAALGEAEAAAIISGNGTNKPTGILHVAPEAAADGSRSAGAFRYIASGAADTLGTDGGQNLLVDMVYSLKADYRGQGRWVMNSATAGTLRKLKDADGRLLWSDGLSGGEPARLLGYPVTISEAMPSIAANAHPIAFGDWRRAYVLADRGGLRITVDDNITVPGMVRWYVRRRVGGIGHDNNAVVFAKVAAS